MCSNVRFTANTCILICFAAGILTGQTDDLASKSQRAKELMAAGRFDQAIPLYQQLVHALPGNPGLLLNLGLAEEMAGQPQNAIPRFQAVLTVQPDSVPALTSLATAQLQLNRPHLAVDPLRKLIRLEPKDLNARGMLAGADMSVQNFEDAAEQYRQLISLDASDPKGWYGLGKSYEALANRTFNQLSKANPQSPYVAALLADSRLQRRQFRSAFFFYSQAEAKLPSLPGLHAGLAQVYQNTGHADWATSEQSEEQTAVPANCNAQMAECRFLQGDFLGAAKIRSGPSNPAALFWATKAYNQLAMSAFDHLGELPDSVEIHSLKAEILHGHGQDVEAAAEWRAALALTPGDQRLETELATSLFLAHRYDEAMPMLARMLTREPGAPDLNFMMGQSLWRTQQPRKALPYLSAALKTEPAMLPAHAALGMVYALLDQPAEAVPHLEKAVSLDDDGSIHYSLARAYQAAGDSKQAQRAMQQYQQIRQKNQEVNEELAKEAEITAPEKK